MMASSDAPGLPTVQPAPGGALSPSPEPEEEVDTSAAARAALAPPVQSSQTASASTASPAAKIKAKLNEAGEDLKKTNERLTAENAKVEGEHMPLRLLPCFNHVSACSH